MPYLDSPFRIISENFSTYFWQHHDFINLLRHAYCVQFAVRSHMPSLFSADQIQTFAFLYELKSDRGFGVSIWCLLKNFSTYFWQHHDFINLLRHAYCVQFAVRSHMPSLFSADQIQTFAFLYELKSDRDFGVSIWCLLTYMLCDNSSFLRTQFTSIKS